MKHLFLALLMVGFAQSAFAAELKLEGGQTVKILAGQETEVSCSIKGNPATCREVGNAFARSVETCYKAEKARGSGDAGEDCTAMLWPKFMKNYPGCGYAAQDACISYCSRDSDAASCAVHCS